MTVICQEHSQTNLRWAANTLTTNGVMRSRRCHRDRRGRHGADGPLRGGQCQRGRRVRRRSRIVATGRGGCSGERPVPRRRRPGRRRLRRRVRAAPEETSPDGLRRVRTGAWATGSGGLGREEFELFGFAEHDVTTTYLGNTAGLRLRVTSSPPGAWRSPASPTGARRSTWVGRSTRDFTDIDVDQPRRRGAHAARLGRALASPSTPDATTSCCLRRRSPICWSTCTGPPPLVTPPRAAPSSPARWRYPHRRAAHGEPALAPQRPRLPGHAVRALRRRSRVRLDRVGLRQRTARWSARPGSTTAQLDRPWSDPAQRSAHRRSR